MTLLALLQYAQTHVSKIWPAMMGFFSLVVIFELSVLDRLLMYIDIGQSKVQHCKLLDSS